MYVKNVPNSDVAKIWDQTVQTLRL